MLHIFSFLAAFFRGLYGYYYQQDLEVTSNTVRVNSALKSPRLLQTTEKLSARALSFKTPETQLYSPYVLISQAVTQDRILSGHLHASVR